VGGDTLAWLTRSMRQDGAIASFGNAGGVELHTTVFPFILRGVKLLGVDSAATAMPLRREIWRRLAGDLYPSALARVVHTVSFADLPAAFQQLLHGEARGRCVVDIVGMR
jgi:NADPH2:quinone reductase